MLAAFPRLVLRPAARPGTTRRGRRSAGLWLLLPLVLSIAGPSSAQPAAERPAEAEAEAPRAAADAPTSVQEASPGAEEARPGASAPPLEASGGHFEATGDLLPLLGGEAGLWLLEPGRGDDLGSTVVHIGPFPEATGTADPLRRASTLRGRVTHAAAVGDGDTLWVVFEGNSVERLMVPRAEPPSRPGHRLGFMPAPAVPAGHRAVAAAATGETLWLVAERDDATIAGADRTADPSVLNAEPDTDAPEAPGGAANADAEEAEGGGAAVVPTRRGRTLGTIDRRFSGGRPDGSSGLADVGDDRLVLLGLGRRGWTRHRLPESASEAGGTWQPLAGDETLEPASQRPHLLHRSVEGRWTLHRPRPERSEGWDATDLGVGPPLAAAPVRVSGVPLWLLATGEPEARRNAIARASADAAAGAVAAVGTTDLEAIRPGPGAPRATVARVVFDPSAPLVGLLSASGRAWLARPAAAPAPAGEDLPAWARFAREPAAERGLSLEPIELDGTRGSPRRVGVTVLPPAAGVADSPLLLVVLMVATVATFLFWRRDPRRQRLRLRGHQQLAGVGQRMGAGVIDSVPGVVAVWWLLGAEPADLAAHWPGLGRPGLPAETLPPLLFVLITVLHTGLSEMVWARSVGKVVLRLRVTDLQGRPVRWDRALARMALKPVDLLAVLLMVLPLINPHRQRLADLVAGTVVLGEDTKDAEGDEPAPKTGAD